MNESAPFIPADEAREARADDESSQTKRAELLAELFRKLRRIRQGVETEVDENTRQFKASLSFMGLSMGSGASLPTDDED